jgi:predicted dehydrogenase
MNTPACWAGLIGMVGMLGAATRAAPGAGPAPVRLVVLDPGHFHAALFQKEMLPEIDRRVFVYAPAGADLQAYVDRVNAFNSRAASPTAWALEIHTGADFLPRLLAERPGNVVVVSGNNRGKIGRLEAVVDAGLHTLADKPWIIEPGEFAALERTLALARTRRVVAYDAMTQRYEITCRLQQELVNDAAIFGRCENGTEQEPAVYMESVHFLRKEVAGAPLLRPAWFFDASQQGEPLADVGTHLVDLVQWMLAPAQALDPRRDLEVLRGTSGTIRLTREQFKGVTGMAEFPAFLRPKVRRDRLEYVARNSVSYTLRGVHVKLDVLWDYEAPPGGKDTELAIFRGTRARVEVRQGKEEQFVPEVFVVPNRAGERGPIEAALRSRLARLSAEFPGLTLTGDSQRMHIRIPAALRVSHEAHFALLVRQFLTYVERPELVPAWETAFMRAKYHVTTEGVRLGRRLAASPATAAR